MAATSQKKFSSPNDMKLCLNIALPVATIPDKVKTVKKGKKKTEVAVVNHDNGERGSIEVNINSDETLTQLKENLSIIPKTENFTSYSIFYGDVNLNQFDEFSTFNEMFDALSVTMTETIDLTLRENAYKLSGVYDHINKFRQIIGLHFLDKRNGLLGINAGASKFDDLKLNDGEADISQEVNVLTTASTIEHHGTLNDPYSKYTPPVKLTFSPWNPVPLPRKIAGDLLYITITTLEHETFTITCHASGFFVNSSSSVKFNPAPKSNVHHLLFDLIKELSPVFEAAMVKNTAIFPSVYDHPETYLLPTVTAYPWITNEPVKVPEPSYPSLSILNNGVDGADFVKDWNEEFQSIKELPKSNINERILREKLLIKIITDFNEIATKTAIEIVKGSIPPMNYAEDTNHLTYLRNGIFYYHAFDNGVFTDKGGDEAARYVASKDLNAVRIINRLDLNIGCLVTCVVDYLGKRIVCQAPIPGIFNNDVDEEVIDKVTEGEDIQPLEPAESSSEKVAYGLNTAGDKINTDGDFVTPLTNVAEAFHLKPHTVNLGEQSVELVTSKDIKGIKGTDGRKYVIDLYRTTGIDVNFLKKDDYVHKEPLIRHEAVEEWWKRKIANYLKLEAEKLDAENKTGEKSAKDQILIQPNMVTINPDSFTGFSESESDQSEIQELSDFIKILIDEFLIDTTKNLAPFDGKHLSTLMHRYGINIRYMGYVARRCIELKNQELEKLSKTIQENELLVEQLAKEEESNKETKKQGEANEKKEESEEPPSKGTFLPLIANYEAIHKISINEMIARGVKHVLRKTSASIDSLLMPYFVSHIFNCLLNSHITDSPKVDIPLYLKKLYATDFEKLTSKDVFKLVESEIESRFDFKLGTWENIDKFVIMREISLKFGIQWKTKNYDELFSAEDIINFVPVIKDSTHKSSILDEILDTAQRELASSEESKSDVKDKEQETEGENTKTNEDKKKEALVLFNELLSFHEQIYGRIHPETTSYCGFLSQLYSELKFESNLSHTACILSERSFGIDSYNTITSYVNAGYFETKDLSKSIKLYNHAIKVWTIAYGQDHPSLINTFANLAESLSINKNFSDSFKLFDKAIEMCEKINGATDITALIYFRFGSALINGSNFKLAKEKFEKAYEIFIKVLGPHDQFTKKSLNFKSNLTTYLEYQKENTKPGKPVNRPVTTAKPQPSKNKKKGKKNIKINEEIASQSVDDILAFIEGKK